MLSLACWVQNVFFRRVPLQLVLQWWLHSISIRCYHGERNLRACIIEQQGLVWWFGVPLDKIRNLISYIQGNLNSNCYIREVLGPKELTLLQATPHSIFQQDNAQPYMGRIVQVFFDEWWTSLLPWFAHSPDMSPSENVWDMTGRQLIHYGPPGTTLYALWIRIQIVWREIPQQHIQALFDSLPLLLGKLHITLKSHSHRSCTLL